MQKGERTKATQSRRGVLELANSGTLFIDDIDELEPEAQSALLRALQEGQVTRIGGDKPSKIDLRLIAACCEPLDSLVARGAFFEDLYYALNVFPVYVPPLRDRQADILPLAELFLRQASEKQDKTVKRISTPAIDLLNQYHWPGNLSELANCIERAVENCDEGVIRAYHLPPTLQSADSSDTGFSLSFGESVAKFEQELLVEALKKASGNMFKAARELRESYRVVNYKVKKYGLIPKRFLGGK